MKNFLKEFNSPGADRRGMPFWAWNAELDEGELTRQVRFFKEMGLGGFFMHARVGLATEYLGEKWFSCVRACVEEAKRCGMNPCLYDEDRWPSGAAGSIVTKDDRFKMKELRWECAKSADALKNTGNTVAWYAALLDEKKRTFKTFRRISDPALPIKSGETLVRIYWKNEDRTSWFNGETYLDTMNPEAVQAFIDATHEKYFSKMGEEFGKTIPSIFTDEPCYAHFPHMALPWTPALPEKFKERYNYDLLDNMVELFFNPEERISQVRYHFFDLATDLFVKAFSKTIGEWCGAHNIKLTGHALGEDSLSSQVLSVGSVMRFYEFMQLPGIDLLMEVWDIFTTTKQCVSAARQFGKKERLSEIYGCTGWDFPFAGHKALGDWQFALGINVRCQHLAFYSMAGEAKRDYPASISYQSPWAKEYTYVEDYFARLGTTLTGAEEIRDLLVIHPIESFWSIYLPFEDILPENRPPFDKEFEWLTKELLSENLDFDYGDEEILSRLSKINGNELAVGEAVYKAVLIPELITLRRSTLELLKEFAAAGGQVCYLGKAPAYLDAAKSDQPAAVYQEYFQQVSKADFVEKLSPASRRVSMRGEDGREIRPLLFFFGKQPEFYTLFVNNFGKEFPEDILKESRVHTRNDVFPSVDVTVKIPEYGKVYELDPATGDIFPVDAEYRDGAYHFKTSFTIRESHLFVFSESMPQDAVKERFSGETSAPLQLPADQWQFSLDDYTPLVLDHADISIDGEKKMPGKFILQADNELRQMLGCGRRGEAMVQPWMKKKTVPEKSLDLLLEYTFKCDIIPAGTMLAIEEPEKYRITVNGKVLEYSETAWWVDRSLRTIAIPDGFLIRGENRITLETVFDANCSGLENIYILGKFGVKDDVITGLPETLSCTDWCGQSLPYYSGSVTYSRQLPALPAGKRVFLNIPAWKGSVMVIRVNDQSTVTVAWPPEHVELTGLKGDGSDILKITVFSHRRNAFGPFYLKDGWMDWIGSKSFNSYETGGRKMLVPCGLLAAPELKIEK